MAFCNPQVQDNIIKWLLFSGVNSDSIPLWLYNPNNFKFICVSKLITVACCMVWLIQWVNRINAIMDYHQKNLNKLPTFSFGKYLILMVATMLFIMSFFPVV